MKRCLILIYFTPVFAFASLQQGLERIIHQTSPKANIGVQVMSVAKSKILYDYKGGYLFTPASVQKLFTSIAALIYLGSDFQFHTQIFRNGEDIYIKFNGDPEFTKDDLSNLIQQLKGRGINQISGNIYIDNSAYDSVPYAPGLTWDDMVKGYGAPLNAILIDHNEFVLTVTPNETLGKPPILSAKLPNGSAYFYNQFQTTEKFTKRCPASVHSNEFNQYQLRGCVGKRWGKQYYKLAIRNPIMYARGLMQELLRKNHILYSGKINLKVTPSDSQLIAEHISDPLTKIVKKTLKDSDNLAINSLLKTLGQRFYSQQGTWQNGLEAMKQILKPSGIDFKHNLLIDGAGLSRYNLIAPLQLTQLLNYAYRNGKIQSELLDALPIAGKDGTLAWRMPGERKHYRVHAKTGTLGGVTALAGYIFNEQYGVLSFAIIVNGFVGKARPYARIEDKLCEYLANYRGK